MLRCSGYRGLSCQVYICLFTYYPCGRVSNLTCFNAWEAFLELRGGQHSNFSLTANRVPFMLDWLEIFSGKFCEIFLYQESFLHLVQLVLNCASENSVINCMFINSELVYS